MDSLVFSDEKDSKEYRDNISNNHSDDATTTVSKYSYDANNNNNRDLFYVIALVPHQLPGKVDPRRWHYQQSRDNAAARMRR